MELQDCLPDGGDAVGGRPPWLIQLSDENQAVSAELGYPPRSVDQEFIAFLRIFGRFGYFTFGPITIDVGLVEDLFWRTEPRAANSPGLPMLSPDFVAHYVRFWEEFRKSGRDKPEPMHMLLAYMRAEQGLTAKVFGELGVSPEDVLAYAAGLSGGRTDLAPTGAPPSEKLYSTEEAAAYFNVHVQTVRVWIRTGRLPAFRLAGQKAIRIRERDLLAVLEPIDPSDINE